MAVLQWELVWLVWKALVLVDTLVTKGIPNLYYTQVKTHEHITSKKVVCPWPNQPDRPSHPCIRVHVVQHTVHVY